MTIMASQPTPPNITLPEIAGLMLRAYKTIGVPFKQGRLAPGYSTPYETKGGTFAGGGVG